MTDTLQPIAILSETALRKMVAHVVKFVQIAKEFERMNIPQIKQGSIECMLAVTSLPMIENYDVRYVEAEAESALRDAYLWDDEHELGRAVAAVTLVISSYMTLYGALPR